MKNFNNSLRRINAVFFIITAALLIMPLAAGVYAAEDGDEYYEDVRFSKEEAAELGLKKGETREVLLSEDDEEVIASVEKAKKEHGIKDADDFDAEEKAPAEELVEVSPDSDELPEIKIGHSFSNLKKLNLQTIIVNEDFISVSEPNANGYVTVKADLSKYREDLTFNSVYVDGTLAYDAGGRRNLNLTIDMKKLDVGYHTLFFYYNLGNNLLTDESGNLVYSYAMYVPTYIYSAPSNSAGYYITTQKAIKMYFGGTRYAQANDEYLDVYMDYRKGKKGKWSSKVYGPVSTSSYYMSKLPKKLKPNKTYYARMIFGKSFEYDGKSFLFTGRLTKKTSGAAKLKTAYSKKQMKKLLKGISIKARVKSYKYWRAYKNTYYWWGVRTHYKKARAYYTISTVTIRFKKKPGIAGIQVKDKYGTIQRNGNRKKYTFKIQEYGRKRGRKYNMRVRTFRSKSYEGVSPYIGRKVKSH